MDWLMITLAAPRASFGGPAPGRQRNTERAPTRSALLGLVACALGLPRSDSAAHSALSDGLAFASRVDQAGRVEVDYHTAQVGKKTDLKKRVVRTRADELDVPRHRLTTILSERSYRCDYRATVGICVLNSTATPLNVIAAAMHAPKWTLYLGRKSAPLAWPLAPELVTADTWRDALAAVDKKRVEQQALWNKEVRGQWWPLRQPGGRCLHSIDASLREFVAGTQREVIRRSGIMDRERWLFCDVATIEYEEASHG